MKEIRIKYAPTDTFEIGGTNPATGKSEVIMRGQGLEIEVVSLDGSVQKL